MSCRKSGLHIRSILEPLSRTIVFLRSSVSFRTPAPTNVKNSHPREVGFVTVLTEELGGVGAVDGTGAGAGAGAITDCISLTIAPYAFTDLVCFNLLIYHSCFGVVLLLGQSVSACVSPQQ